MIGNGLIRFHPFVQGQQDGGAILDKTWKVIKSQGPTMLKDVLSETALAGMKGLKAGTKRGRVNWQGGIKAAKQGAKRAIKRKATQALQKAATKRIKRDLFGL